ncbi:MAG: acyltransferase [Planctomycetales bacterium]|nr:acyltransferase [Planctomycetales bacterium]
MTVHPEPASTHRPLGYMPQLDSLRAIAVLGVFAAHFLSHTSIWGVYVNTGDLGVKLFFVLSGFLITSILLSAKDKIHNRRTTRRQVIVNFYLRRYLRLTPAYFLYITLGLFMLPGFSQHFIWFLFYLQNFLFAAKPETFSVYMPHFWTLAIEEQFYLVMPCIVILVPKPWLLPASILLVCAGPLFRILGMVSGFTEFQVALMLPSQFDTLGMGVLLAVLIARFGHDSRRIRTLLRTTVSLGVPGACLAIYSAHVKAWPLGTFVAMNFFLGCTFVWVIWRAAAGFHGIVGRVLEWSPLVYLGRISYGLYVYHFNVHGLLREHLLPRLGLSIPDSELARYALFAAVAIVLASCSWHFFEQPLNRLKDRFPYANPRPQEG